MLKCLEWKKESLMLGEFLFIIVFSIILTLKGFGIYDGQLAFKVFIPIALMILLFKILVEEHSFIESIVVIILLGLFGGLYLITDNKGYIINIILFLGAKNVSFKRAFHSSVVFAIISIVINYGFAFAGKSVGATFIHNKLGGEILRYSFGNSHPNNMHMTYVIMCILLLYSLKDDIEKLKKYNLVLVLVSVLLFLYTLSYTGIMLSAFIFVGVIYFCLTHSGTNVIEIVIVYFSILICFLFSSIFPFLLLQNNELFEKINWDVFHGRLSFLISYYKAYDVSVFPQRINDYSRVWYQLDNSFAELFLECGIIVFLGITIFIMYTIWYLFKKNNKLAIIFIVVQLLGGISDPYLFNSSSRNLIILWMGQCFYDFSRKKFGNKVIRIAIFDDIRGVTITMPQIYGKWDIKRNLRYLLIIISLAVAISSSLIVNMYKKWPQAYGVAAEKSDIEWQESNGVSEQPTYGELVDREDIVIYNVHDFGEKIVVFDTPRMLAVERIRYLILVFVNTFVITSIMILLIYRLGQKEDKIREK